MEAPVKIEKWVNGRVRKVKPTDLDRDRIRFNWGYHDGANEAENGVFKQRLDRWGKDWQSHHHDPVYVAGYLCGFEDQKAGTYANNSDPAWKRSGREGTEENITAYRWN